MTILFPQYELVVKTKEILNIKNCHITTVVCQCHKYVSFRIQIIEYEFYTIYCCSRFQ